LACAVVTGGAGFIGSSLVRALLEQGDTVRVVDDFSTGYRANLGTISDEVELHEVSICDTDGLAPVFRGADVCYHQAALPSVLQSVVDPLGTHQANVAGTLNVFIACRNAGVHRVVYASSSSVYGNATEMPVHEAMPLCPISPYAAGKASIELYARTFSDLYDVELVGLRYFNVFGPRQDPNSHYSAVIPIFVRCMLKGERPVVYGDGHQSRDFTYVANAVSANILAGSHAGRLSGVFNIACGRTLSLVAMIGHLNTILGTSLEPEFAPARPCDVQRSLADISRARDAFGYEPVVHIEEGLQQTLLWYAGNAR